MTAREQRIIGLLKSWEEGYISPSAQMAIKEARELIEELIEAREQKAKGKKNAKV